VKVNEKIQNKLIQVTVNFSRINPKKTATACSYFNVKMKQIKDNKEKVLAKHKIKFGSLKKMNNKINVYFQTGEQFMKNIKTLNITIEFKNRNLIGMLKVLKDFKIDATDFKKVSIISKTLEIRNHTVKIEAGVRTAFDGKEMVVVPKKSLKISHFFKSFPSWLKQNQEKIQQGQLTEVSDILQ